MKYLEILWENTNTNYDYVQDWTFDRLDANSNYVGKWGENNYSYSNATSNCSRIYYTAAIGFNTKNSVNCGLLPIVLKTFTAKKESNNVNIDWITATEINNDYFTIERSVDGINFEKIKQIKGAGNSNQQLNYNFTDNNPEEGINYYRLKQTDFDGTYTYSKIQAVNFEDTFKPNFNIYPNPASTFVQIKGKNLVGHRVKVYDITGKPVSTFEKLKPFEKLNISNLQKGMYFITVNNSKPVKFIKK